MTKEILLPVLFQNIEIAFHHTYSFLPKLEILLFHVSFPDDIVYT
jgi:hypothetical protein